MIFGSVPRSRLSRLTRGSSRLEVKLLTRGFTTCHLANIRGEYRGKLAGSGPYEDERDDNAHSWRGNLHCFEMRCSTWRGRKRARGNRPTSPLVRAAPRFVLSCPAAPRPAATESSSHQSLFAWRPAVCLDSGRWRLPRSGHRALAQHRGTGPRCGRFGGPRESVAG